MSSESVWEEIKQALSELCENEVFLGASQSFFIKLQQWADADIYPPDIFQAFIKIFQYMSADIQNGHSIKTLLKKVSSGTYVQPEWTVNDVYQANGHIFKIIFNNFSEEIEKDESCIPIPVVLLVMNYEEAQALMSGTAFQNHHNKLGEDFESLKTLLVKHGIEKNWYKRYKAKPEEWQPFISKEKAVSIKQIIEQALDFVKSCNKKLAPHFIDIRTLNKPENRSTKFGLKELRDGCIVIMDIISMRHPKIQQAFRKSLLDAFPNTLVASISPIPTENLKTVSQTIILIEQHTDLEFEKRYEIDFDNKCKKIAEQTSINRWIQQISDFFPDEFQKVSQGSNKYWYHLKSGN